MGDLRYKVVIDEDEARRKISELLKGSGVSSKNDLGFKDAQKNADELISKIDDLKKRLDTLGKIQLNLKSKTPISENDLNAIQTALSNLSLLSDASVSLATRYTTLRKESDSLTSAKKALNTQFEQGEISIDQYNKSLTAVNQSQKAVAVSLQDLNRDIKQAVQLENVAAGSLQEARIKYSQLTAEIIRTGGAMDGSNPAVNKMIERHQALRQEIENVEHRLGDFRRGVGNYARGWNGIQNSINQLTRELPAFTYSIQTGFMAISNNLPVLADEIKKIRIENEELNASGKKGVPVWKQLLGSLLSWQTAMSLGITLLTVYGKEIGEWISSLFKGKKAIDALKESQKSLNEGLKSAEYKKAVTEVKTLELAVSLAKKGIISKQSVLQEYNKTIGQVTGQVKTFGQVENFLAENAENYVKMTLYKAAANKALEESAKAVYEAEMAKLKSPEESLTGWQKFVDGLNRMPGLSGPGARYDVNKAESQAKKDMLRMGNATRNAVIEEAKKTEITQNKIASDFLKQAQKNAVKMGVNIFGDSKGNVTTKSSPQENLYKQILHSRNGAYEKLLQIDREYAKKRLDSDQAEIQALKDKFAEVRKTLEEENKKIVEFNNKNKGKKGFTPVAALNVSDVDPIEQRAINDTVYKQQTAHLLKSYQDDYSNYAKYEDLKREHGVRVANERYSAELDITKTFGQKIEEEMSKLLETDPTKMADIEKERLAELTKLQADWEKDQTERNLSQYLDAIKLSSTYNDQLLSVEKKYQDAFSALGENASKERKAQLHKSLQEEKSAILVAQYEREADTEKMFYRLSILGKKAAFDAIAQARKVLLEMRGKGMSDKDFERDSFQLDNAEAQVNLDKSWIASTGALKKYREQVQLYGKDSDQAKQAQKDMFTALASDLKNAQQIIGDVNGLLGSIGASDNLQNTVNQIGNLVGGMGELAAGIASGNPISIISGSIKTLTSALDLFNTKDKKLQKQIDAYKTQLDSLGKAYDTLQRRISNSVGENYYSDSDKAIANLKEQQRILSEMAKAEEDKKRTDKEKVRGYYDEIDSINKQIEDIQKSITENLVQTTFKDLSASLADALVTAFEAGESAVDSLDETFDKFIKNALVNSLKLKMIEPIVNDMVNQLADYMKSNNNTLTGFNFSVWKDKIDGAGTEFTKTLEEAYKQLGLSKDGTSTGGGLKGSIQREVTEATQSENNGLLRSQTELLKRSFDESKSQGITMGKQLAVALDQLTALNAIQVNTGETVKRLDTAVSELKSINKSLGGRF
ncbi:hypothetical protein [Sphingobacterium sp. UGAL515B_05]|uniref:hypothetical protein n=1 Tax=Sphingobacterium sp. UGAL515B_05 TaxID=2986767 RepID=UPI002952D4F3|nr:hypothetical protein [Sphingobacterium sp. UGAL515B_05]WON94759.1 hypothetical protein OK025_26430 [Sphingobacterium sp. UGAL515B_05]